MLTILPLACSSTSLEGAARQPEPEAPPHVVTPARADDLQGRVFVYTEGGYAVRVVNVYDGQEEPWLRLETFESKRPARRVDLPLSGISFLREPVGRERAVALEDLIVHAAPVASQAPHLDLVLYILGTPEQAAVAVATLMDRAMDPNDHDARGDLRFLEMKILGELAYVAGRADDVSAYAATLEARRRAAPAAERTRTVAAPKIPPIPTQVLGDELEAVGWHNVTVPIGADSPWQLGDIHTEDHVLTPQHKVAGKRGEWHLSVHELGDERLDWVVLSHGAAFTVTEEAGRIVASGPGGPITLDKVGQTTSKTGWLGFWVDPPREAGRATAFSPRGRLHVWPYGADVQIQQEGTFDVYGAPQGSGLLVWATRVPWDDAE